MRWMMWVLVAGCAKQGGLGGGTTVLPSGLVYLRSSLDADGSPYIGRFVPTGASQVDETAAMSMTCSAHIKHRFIDGGGVKYSELFEMSTSVAARVGAPAGTGKASLSRNALTRVDYELTGKLVAELTDPAAFAACCADNPAQCTDRYVGEFLQGKGTIFRERALEVSGNAAGLTGAGAGSVVASHGTSWEQAIAFPNPVYFAFKLTETPYKRVTSACGDWVDSPPVAEGGKYYVGAGMSAAKTEAAARNRALRSAWMKAYVANGGVAAGMSEDGEQTDGSDPVMQWVVSMAPREWCVEATSDGKYTAKVLGWLPDQ